ncbi:MAG: HipA domain-containing protein [Mediterraneibacter gnavus]|uniref:HipA domain-containing protein n=1 Tax=Faecalimonas umbilicata TaxID=1912855 RepID=UPI0039945086
MIDFTGCQIDSFRAYDGANGSKICVLYQGERYMIKFPSYAKHNPQMHYSNGCINEYLASTIYQSLGIETQETCLGIYEGKEVVACKDFCATGERILNFGMMKNQCIDSIHGGYGTELESVLTAIDMQQIYDPIALRKRFWKMFAADALLGNFDRHNGNWGVIVNENTMEVRMAPVYDNGSCLYPQLTDEQMKAIMKDPKEIENRIYVFPNSALKEQDRKINYFSFLSTTKNKDCIEALRYVQQHYNEEKIKNILAKAPISNVKKEFYLLIIKERKNKIIDKALELQIERKKAEKTVVKKKIRNL